MKKRVERIVIDGETKYRVYQKKNIFSKWDHIIFIDEDSGNQYPEFTAEQMFNYSANANIYFSLDEDIKDELWDKHLEKEIKEHCENVYHINKWQDPEHNFYTETLCGAKEIGDLSDGYHTFNELYYYRMLYNALWINQMSAKKQKEMNVHKSKKHHDGEECFGGDWFVVSVTLPTGQITNHYEMKYWDLFKCEAREVADEWDGHTPQEAAERMKDYLLL